MTYTLLPELYRGYLLVYATLIVIMFIYGIVRMIDSGRRNMHLVCSCVMAVTAFTLYQGMVMYQQEDIASYDIPVWILVAALTILLIYAVYMHYSISIWQKTNITGMSVKEAFDRLPSGLAYYTESGVPIMVNEAMQELSRSIFGEPVMDTGSFWEKVKKYECGDAATGDYDTVTDDENAADGRDISIDDDIAIITAGDNKIYSIRRRCIRISGVDVYELIASDISVEYELTRELEGKRDKARVLNSRLKTLMKTVDYVSMNRELLKLKTALHDNIGQSILIARRYLSAPESVDRKGMLEFWQDNVKHLISDEPEEWELPYYVISREADMLGIKLDIIGELPKDKELIAVVDAAVSTVVSNTLKHTNGTKVTIAVSETADDYCMNLSNNGEALHEQTELQGGLENLRGEIEDAGGRMEIVCSPDYMLKITLPKGGRRDV